MLPTLAAAAVLALALLPVRTQVASAGPAPITWITSIPVNGVQQAIEVRGNDPTAPLLLVIHGGPGYAMIDLLHEIMPGLEDDFTVVNYDQRGAGLSYDPSIDPATMTLAQFVDDADTIRGDVLAHLGLPANHPVYVMGHSMGTMIGLQLVAHHPDHYAAFIGVGQVVNVATNEQGSYDFALSQALLDGNNKAIDQLMCVGRPHLDFSYGTCEADPFLQGFDVTDCWMEYYGGDVWGATSDDPVYDTIITSPAYKGRYYQWWDGLSFSQNLFNDPQIPVWNAKLTGHDLAVPQYFFQGHHDEDTPWPLVEPYAASIAGPHRLLWFENSSHFPFFEESTAFQSWLHQLRTGALVANGSVTSATMPIDKPTYDTPLDPCQVGASHHSFPAYAPTSAATPVVAAPAFTG